MNPALAVTIAVGVSLALIGSGLFLVLRGSSEGQGGALSAAGVKIEGGPGIVLVALGVAGLALTAWWDFPGRSDPQPVDTPVDDYLVWLTEEVAWCDLEGWDQDPQYCDSIYLEAFG